MLLWATYLAFVFVIEQLLYVSCCPCVIALAGCFFVPLLCLLDVFVMRFSLLFFFLYGQISFLLRVTCLPLSGGDGA